MTDISGTATTTSMKPDEDVPVETYPFLYWGILVVLIVIGFVGGLAVHTFSEPVFIGGESFDNGALFAVIVALYLVAGLRSVDAQRIGGVFVFDMPTIEVSGQWVIVPPGIAKLKTLPILTKQMEIPADPENIFRGDGSVPEGMRPPTRITFAEGTDNKDDPLERRVTVEVPQIFRFRIRKGSFFQFWLRIGGDEEFTEAQRQLEDIGVGYISEVLPKLTLGYALKSLGELNKQLTDIVDTATKSWGVDIITANIKQFVFSHTLNAAIQSIPEAVAKKTSGITDAERDKQKAILAGEGAGGAAKAEAIGRGQGLKEMATTLGVKGADTLAADVAREFARGPATKIVLGSGGLRDVMGLGAAVAEIAKDTTPSPTPPLTTPPATGS